MTNLAPANWQDWAAVAQIIALGFVIFAALLARNQIIEATKARQLSVFNEILDQISRPDVGEARRWIFAAFPKETKEVISNADMLGKARKVAVAYDRVGFFIKN